MAAGGSETYARVVRQHITNGAGCLVLDEFGRVARHVEWGVHHIQIAERTQAGSVGYLVSGKGAWQFLGPSRIGRYGHGGQGYIGLRMYGRRQQHTNRRTTNAQQASWAARDTARMPPQRMSAGATIRGLRSATREAASHGVRNMLVILYWHWNVGVAGCSLWAVDNVAFAPLLAQRPARRARVLGRTDRAASVLL